MLSTLDQLSVGGAHEQDPSAKTPAGKRTQRGLSGATRVLLLSGIWEVALYRAEALRVGQDRGAPTNALRWCKGTSVG